MARIRTMKPELFQDEKLAPLDVTTRFVFLGLIAMADDAGRVLDNVRIIDAFVFPETTDSSREALASLSRIARIQRGTTASGQRVIQIVNWKRHQRIDHPNLKAALPELATVEPVTEIRETLATDSRDIREPLAHHTSDQRPATSTNNGAKTPRRAREKRGTANQPASWVAQFGDRWKAVRGKPSYPRIGKALSDLIAAHGVRQVGAAWDGYLRDREGKEFAGPEDFAGNYEVYRAKHALESSPAGDGWVPMPSEPEAV